MGSPTFTEREMSRFGYRALEDYTRWGNKSVWNSREAIALISGIDPLSIQSQRYASEHPNIERYSEWLSGCIEVGKPYRFNTLTTYAGVMGVSWNLEPTQVLEWAEIMEISPPDGLVKAVNRHSSRNGESREDKIRELEQENKLLKAQLLASAEMVYPSLEDQMTIAGDMFQKFSDENAQYKSKRAAIDAFINECWNNPNRKGLVENRKSPGNRIDADTFERSLRRNKSGPAT